MKKIILPLVAGMLLSQAGQAAVQSLPFTDRFNYPAGNLPAVAPAGVWDVSGQSGPEITVQTNAALTSPPGFTNSFGNGVRWQPSGTARRNMVQFGPIANAAGNAVYASFLISVQNSGTVSKQVVYMNNANTQPSSAQPLGVWIGSGTIGIGKSANPAFTTPISSGTHLVVVRYTFTGTSTDQADMWLDPTNTSYGAATAPTPSGGASGGSNPTQLTYFGIYAASGTSPSLYLDEVRISTNWTDVVPGTPPSQPPAPSNPTITETFLSNEGSMVLRGIGGSPTGTYEVISATDMSTPVSNWNSIATSQFDVSGNFDITNSVSPLDLQRFYRIFIAGTNQSAVAPSITNQPVDQIILEGQTAVFSVGATGSSPLNYQWYFNTNSPLSLATNAVLTISNVQSNNIGAYSVIVSNSAGSVTSSYVTLTIGEPVTNGNYYVSANGNDNNDGSFPHPFYSLQKAQDLAQPGNIIYIRGNAGPIMYSTTVRLTNSGTVNAPIKLWAYPGEYPVLNYSNQPYGSNNRAIILGKTNTTSGLVGSYWHIKGIEIAYAGDNGIKLESSHNLIEQCVFHHCGDTGLQIGFAHETHNPGTWAASNTILNCDSYMNYDLDNRGSDADGFACKLHPGPGNIFIGCRAWKNSDDGYDLFETDDSVILSNCWAWHSGDGSLYNVTGGSFQGNGNGIKLGGNGSGGSSMGIHYAINCIAFNCSFKSNAEGFTNNSHDDGLRIYNCLGFNNSSYNFFIEDAGSDVILRNNVSFGAPGGSGTGVTIPSGTQDHNSWNLPVSANSADFGSLLESAAEAPRAPDGSLPAGFAHLVAGSDLINAGVDAGLPYCETAPDLGAFEYCP